MAEETLQKMISFYFSYFWHPDYSSTWFVCNYMSNWTGFTVELNFVISPTSRDLSCVCFKKYMEAVWFICIIIIRTECVKTFDALVIDTEFSNQMAMFTVVFSAFYANIDSIEIVLNHRLIKIWPLTFFIECNIVTMLSKKGKRTIKENGKYRLIIPHS